MLVHLRVKMVADQVRCQTVVSTVAGSGAWANATAAAVCDGLPGVYDTPTCTWTSSTASDVGKITLGGILIPQVHGNEQFYSAGQISVRHLESSATLITTVAVQLQTAAGVSIGSSTNLTLSTVAVTGVASSGVNEIPAQFMSPGMQVLITITKSATASSSVFSLDAIDFTATFRPMGSPVSNINCAPMIRSSVF
jgi:hypothetical protein